ATNSNRHFAGTEIQRSDHTSDAALLPITPLGFLLFGQIRFAHHDDGVGYKGVGFVTAVATDQNAVPRRHVRKRDPCRSTEIFGTRNDPEKAGSLLKLNSHLEPRIRLESDSLRRAINCDDDSDGTSRLS